MSNVTLILPTYNERENVKTLVAAIEGVFKNLDHYVLTIIVVDDNSPDGTAQVVRDLAREYKNITLLSKKKEGLGAAYIFGINYALKHLDPDIFIQIDADWQHNPLLLPDFFKKMETGCDMVIGSRYISGGSIPGNWGLHRKIYSIVGNTVVRFGLGRLSPHDWTSGYRMYGRQVFEKVKNGLDKYSGYTFQVAFLNKTMLAGFKVGEVPLQFADRVHGKSKIAPLSYIKNLLLYILNNSTFLKYLVIGTLGFTVQTLVARLFVALALFEGLAVGIGSFMAIVTNFIGNNLWTFSHNRIYGLGNLAKKFLHFCATSIGAVIIQVVVVSIGVFIWGKDAWFILMICAIIFLVIPYNYFIYNKYIWKAK